MNVRFVADLPDGNPRGGWRPRKSATDLLREELAAHPGQWAEVQREPREREAAGRQRAQYLKRKGLQATTRMVGDECIVFARVPS